MTVPNGRWRFHVVPHTHWDREWYLPVETFRIRFAHLVDEVIETLERRPEMRFTLDGQAVLLEDYEDYRRDRVQQARLRNLLEAGRISAGPAYVLPDEFCVGQESLVRNLLTGRRVAAQYGARPCEVGYAPDTFGHPAQMPQLLRGFGFDNFVFMRGLGDEGEELGAVFWWEGPDGSRVLAVRTLGGYNNASSLGYETSFGRFEDDADGVGGRAEQRLAAWFERWGDAVERAGLSDVLLCNGVDHRRIQRDLPEVLDLLHARLPEASFEICDYADYLAALRPQVHRLKLGVRRGELLGGRYHTVTRGVNSARIPLKQQNERCERELYEVEALAALATLVSNYCFPADDLRVAWRHLLRNHPHDSIGGCSVDHVHRDMGKRFERCLDVTARLRHEALVALTGVGDQAVWHALDEGGTVRSAVNPLPFARRRLVEVKVPPALRRARALRAITPDGAVPVQRSRARRGRCLVPVSVAGFGATCFELESGSAPARAGAVVLDGPRAIENEHLRVEVEPDGRLRVTDRRSGKVHRGQHRFEDQADVGDSYSFCELAGERPLSSAGASASVRVVEEGPLRCELEIGLALTVPKRLSADRGRRSGRVTLPLRTRVRLDAGADRIELETRLLNRAEDHRLRVVFPAAGGDPGCVRADGHFAVVRRAARVTGTERWKEPPQQTQHTLGAVACGEVNLLTQGLPEYEAIPARGGVDLALTLVRSFGWLSREDLASRPFGAGPTIPTPDGQCQGELVLRYAVGYGPLGDAELVRAGHDFRHDLPHGAGRIDLDGALTVSGDPVACSALKQAEDRHGLVLRLYNPGPDPARLRLGGELSGVLRSRLDEQHEGERLRDGRLRLRPYEIATVRLWGDPASPLRHPDPPPTLPGTQPTMPV